MSKVEIMHSRSKQIKYLIESLKSVALRTEQHQSMWFYSNLDLSTLSLNYLNYGSAFRHDYINTKVSIEISDVSGTTRSEILSECSFLFKSIANFIDVDLTSVKVLGPREIYVATE